MPNIVPIFEPAPGVKVENITLTVKRDYADLRMGHSHVYKGRRYGPDEVFARRLVLETYSMGITLVSPTKPHGVAERLMTGEPIQMGAGVQAYPIHIETRQEYHGLLRRVTWITHMNFILTGDPRKMSLDDPLPIQGAREKLIEAQEALPEP